MSSFFDEAMRKWVEGMAPAGRELWEFLADQEQQDVSFPQFGALSRYAGAHAVDPVKDGDTKILAMFREPLRRAEEGRPRWKVEEEADWRSRVRDFAQAMYPGKLLVWNPTTDDHEEESIPGTEGS